MTWTLFFKLTTNRVSADLQHTSGVSYARSVDGHLCQLNLDRRITGFMCVKGNKCALTITTAIALGTTTCLSEPLHVLSQPAKFTSNRF